VPQYFLIAEFVNKKVGFIIGTFNNENDADSMIHQVIDEFTAYSLNSGLEIPSRYFRKYKSYEIKGDEYFTGCEKYRDRLSSSNGDLTVSFIRCKGRFDAKAFIEYRNFFNVYGAVMN